MQHEEKEKISVWTQMAGRNSINVEKLLTQITRDPVKAAFSQQMGTN